MNLDVPKTVNFIRRIIRPKTDIFKIENRDGTTNASGNIVADTYNHNLTINFGDPGRLQDVYESVNNAQTPHELKENIIKIESLMVNGELLLAIQAYEKLLRSSNFVLYSEDDKFLIYNGILNCHINNFGTDDDINKWIIKIEALGTDIKEIHKFYYLLSLWELNRKNLDNSILRIKQSLEAKSDYINAITMKILLDCIQGVITYSEAKAKFEDLLCKPNLEFKDVGIIHSYFADVAFNSKDYICAQEHYKKSNEIYKNLSKEIFIAICEYYKAFKVIEEDGHVDFENINFEILKSAKEKFDKIYENRTSDNIQVIVRMGFGCYLGILSLTDNFRQIISLYEENKPYFSRNMGEAIKYVVEAEILEGKLNKHILEKLGEYDQIKYETLYLEKIGKYEDEFDILLPAIEGKYRDDKFLQFTLLNAYRGMKDFEGYMHYYKKFEGHNDEIMRMNRVQFLVELDRKDDVLSEINRIKSVIKNAGVVYELFLIYIKYGLEQELDDFFDKVENGEYKVLDIHKPSVFYHKMIHLLDKKDYDKYFNEYEKTDLSFLNKIDRVTLEINYYMFKGKYDELAHSYYKMFSITRNQNDLLYAIQIKVDLDKYHDADFYLGLINPMELDKPEFYYMFKAIIFKEQGDIGAALKILDDCLKIVGCTLDSPFHQFYVNFNINNGRTEEALKYMFEHSDKAPNCNWVKRIEVPENSTGKELLETVEKATGGKRDFSEIQGFYIDRYIGISACCNITGGTVEEILGFREYPFTNINITHGKVNVDNNNFSINKILIDSTTLSILSENNALDLLNVFNELLIPYSVLQELRKRNTSIWGGILEPVFNYIRESPYIKNIAVDMTKKIKEYSSVISEDILDCVSLSKSLKLPFLNTEIAVNNLFPSNNIIDMNYFFLYLKSHHEEMKERVSETIYKMRFKKYNFISFSAEDMHIAYSKLGIESLDAFLYMGRNAYYMTFIDVYIGFLSLIKNNRIDDFELCAKKIINYLDGYMGKTRYYMYCIAKNHPAVKVDFYKLMQQPSIRNIILNNDSYNINRKTACDYNQIINSFEFEKILNITKSFISFIFKFISLANDDQGEREKHIDMLKDNISINGSEDIDYIVKLIM